RRYRCRPRRPDAPGAAGRPAVPRRRELPRAILADRDPGRADDDARSAGRPSARRKPHLRRHGGARRACRLAGPGGDGGTGAGPGRASRERDMKNGAGARLDGGLALGVTAATAALYLFVYTPLKLRTPLCTLIGAVPGALPPVTGWVAAREDLGVGAWVLFGILFLWQLPHTLAIARLYRDDYARAGVRLLPVVDAEGSSTERQIVTGCLALLVVSLLPTLIGLAGAVYFVGAFLMGAAFAAL